MTKYSFLSFLVLSFAFGCSDKFSQMQMQFEDERAAFQRRIDSSQRSIQEKDRLIAEQKEQLTKLETRVKDLEETITRQELYAKQLRLEAADKTQQLIKLKTESEEFDQDIIDAFAKATEHMRQTMDSWENRNEKLQRRISQINESLVITSSYRFSLLNRSEKEKLERALVKARNGELQAIDEAEAELMAIHGSLESARYATEFYKAKRN